MMTRRVEEWVLSLNRPFEEVCLLTPRQLKAAQKVSTARKELPETRKRDGTVGRADGGVEECVHSYSAKEKNARSPVS